MLKNKLLSGYMYRLTPLTKDKEEKNINFVTGKGGAELLIESYKKEGLNDEAISNLIEVFIENYGWIKLSKLKNKIK